MRFSTYFSLLYSFGMVLAFASPGWCGGASRIGGAEAAVAEGEAARRTVLGVRGNRFTINSEPAFLLGISYYGGLGAPEEFVRRDLDDLSRRGFNWLRVFATWGPFGEDFAAVDAEGRPREPFLGNLRRLVADCDRRGLILDITLSRDAGSRGGGLPNFEAHERAVETLLGALKEHRNWYIDLANERDVRDARFVPADELKTLREMVHRLDPGRLVTASLGGHDLSEEDARESLLTVGLDFLSVHRPRGPESPRQTESRTRELRATMEAIGRSVPIHHQEPFRRGYTDWNPNATDFLDDLRGALAGGAAGWCFHNGSQRGAPEERPRRSFDLHDRRLFDQLDEVEREVVARVASVVRRQAEPGGR